MRSFEERKRDNIQRVWSRLQAQARRAAPEDADSWIAAAQRDLLACLAACRVPGDIAVRDALDAAAGLLGGTLASAPDACAWELPQHLRAARAAERVLRPSALREIAIACRDIVRSAVQLADAQAVLPAALAEHGNACLAALQSAFAAAGAAVRITLFDVPESDAPAAEPGDAADDASVQNEAAAWSCRYLREARELQAGFLSACRRAGLYLTDGALQMLSEESARIFAAADGPQDGRQVGFWFWRALRHQADRLQARPGAPDALTGEDLMAAFDAGAPGAAAREDETHVSHPTQGDPICNL